MQAVLAARPLSGEPDSLIVRDPEARERSNGREYWGMSCEEFRGIRQALRGEERLYGWGEARLR